MKKSILPLVCLMFYSVSCLAADDLRDKITVTGNGEIEIAPDIVYLHFSIETEAKKAIESQEKNRKIADKVYRVLTKDLKLRKRDIQTSSFSVRPVYNYTKRKGRVLEGFKTVNSVTVAYRQLNKVGQLLDKLSGAGVNYVQKIRFDTEKRNTYELEATKKAMENARAKAGVIAKAADRSIRKVIRVNHSHSWQAPVQPLGGRHVYRASIADKASSTPVAAGSLKISASVTVDYEM